MQYSLKRIFIQSELVRRIREMTPETASSDSGSDSAQLADRCGVTDWK